VVIESERIVLREVPPAEAETLLRGEHPAGVVWAPGYPLEGTLIAAAAQVDQARSGVRRHGFGMYQVIRRADQAVIGDIGFHGAPDADGNATVGFGVVPEARGQGYAKEALIALSRWAVSQPAVARVLADTTHDNMASLGVLRGAGFRHIRDSAELTYYEWTAS
jgi:RimJ/RimL family protein N-acetyltransferase